MPPAANVCSSSSSLEKKRKRVSRACDQCFLKKDRCDGLQPVCTLCVELDRTCTYDRPERKRGPTQGLRPRLEQRIMALETVLGFLLQSITNDVDTASLKKSDESQRQIWRQQGWLNSKVRLELQDLMGLEPNLVTSNVEPFNHPISTQSQNTTAAERQDSDSDYSEVDLSLPASHNPLNPTVHPPSPESSSFTLPLLSSGKGGSSLNRGLVPRGADPNAVLGGFEIEFGGSEQDVDWVRRFVPPSSSSGGGAARRREEADSGHSSN
ncbi:uncharacterized protein UTRI_05519_B [Ustilago trichophora]|uniref:Zn(2)-C6 fungal-type domain-containing protein n=1 Tax=Ustilago trichophora TaxID=86804 RepID=A0A5C3ENS0_9BASI|nr:uncharacterized protein UTRI_05519_B [Ustilago trichophora]